MEEQKNQNFLLALVLSFAVLLLWQVFFGFPAIQDERERKAGDEAAQTEQVDTSTAPRPSANQSTPQAGTGAEQVVAARIRARDVVLADSPRIAIKTPSLTGSIALKGGRIDDLTLATYTNTIDPKSGHVVLFSPSGSKDAQYAEHGWVSNTGLPLPDSKTLWQAETSGTLTPNNPVTLVWDNGQGLIFRRTISVDDNFMFTVDQNVQNTTGQAVALQPYALVSRHSIPQGTSFFILHEGFTGVLGENDLEEVDYDEDELYDEDNPSRSGEITFASVTGGWLGFTDKYWAAVVVPEQVKTFQGQYSYITKFKDQRFQADFLADAVVIPAGGSAGYQGRLFAGAKQVNLIDAYDEALEIDRFDLLIDWGWLYFLTKPLFYALDYCYKLVGNFGVAILIVTILIKLILFPLANKSYVSMSRMKKLQPEMERIKKRHGDDMMRQQKAMSELYKKEKLNPAAGCWPVLIQIPIFFALYKVLFVTIEMRQAPFFGWIKDLSAPDPTSIWNLFGLLPYDPVALIPVSLAFLNVGAWPVMMGLIMFIQMRLNPTPTDPTQAKLFTWMPLFFTFILAPFPAGLVIYWTWNNLLSVIQQGYIMQSQGVEIALWENLGLKSKSADESTKT